MKEGNYKVYRYRWAVLAATMLVNLTIQALWIAYSPVASAAATYYGVSDLAIGFFAMSFMIAFIPLSIPASWLIDRFGFARIVGAGSIAVGVFGLLRGAAGSNYGLALAATCGIAAAQPLLLNAWTKMPAAWFPSRERATAVGLITIASIAGTAVGLVVTPILAEGMKIATVQLAYGAAAAVAAVIFIVVAREKPALPPDESASRERAFMIEGLKFALRNPSFLRYLAISFIGMGIFNGVTTWVEGIVKPRGIDSTAAGILGAIMLAGGLVGAVIIPAISDRRGKTHALYHHGTNRRRSWTARLGLRAGLCPHRGFSLRPWILSHCRESRGHAICRRSGAANSRGQFEWPGFPCGTGLGPSCLWDGGDQFSHGILRGIVSGFGSLVGVFRLPGDKACRNEGRRGLSERLSAARGRGRFIGYEGFFAFYSPLVAANFARCAQHPVARD